MDWHDQIGYYIGLLVAILGAAATIQQLRKGKRDRAAEARAELAAEREAGRRDRDDEVALLRSELRNAERDRDTAERERDEYKRAEAEARRTLAMMQRPISEYRLPGTESPHRPQPGES